MARRRKDHSSHLARGCSRAAPKNPLSQETGADIESFHNLIQLEFFELSRFEDKADLIDALTAYLFYFNTTRCSLSKGTRTPLEILEPALGSKALHFLSLPPVDLDVLVYQTQSDTYLTSLAVGGPAEPSGLR